MSYERIPGLYVRCTLYLLVPLEENTELGLWLLINLHIVRMKIRVS